jgi:glycine oxidase
LTALAGARVAIVGAGVLGLAAAAELGRRGARCTVFDPAPLGDNASGVSAGMLAPAFESALDGSTRGRFGLLQAARDLWPAFLERHDIGGLDRSGAVWVDPSEGELERVAQALATEGAAFQRLDPAGLSERQPLLDRDLAGGILAPDDWRLEAELTLAALRKAAAQSGCTFEPAAVEGLSTNRVEAAGRTWTGEAVLLCAGYDALRFAEAAPELAVLRAVKGQRLRFPTQAPRSGPVVRSAAGYVTPSAAGALVGATMEHGAADRMLTHGAAAELRAAAARLFPHLAEASAEAAAGVRAETPDGLPLVGRSASGPFLAVGARRNGWLLAPMAAQIVADAIATTALAGGAAGRWAEALRPSRF